MKLISFLFVLLWMLLVIGCQSAPKNASEPSVISADREKAYSLQLSRNLAKTYGAWHDGYVEKTVKNLAKKLIEVDPEYKKDLSDVQILLLQTSQPLLGAGLSHTIYVSQGLLWSIQFENELAFLIGTQLALLKDGMPLRNFTEEQGQDVMGSVLRLPTMPETVGSNDLLKKGWFESGGFFDFGSENYLEADRESIRLCHAAQFDPRGSTTLFQRWLEPAHFKEYEKAGHLLPDLKERLELARVEVAKLAPLRDPIIKTKSFEELHIKLQTLRKSKSNKKTSG